MVRRTKLIRVGALVALVGVMGACGFGATGGALLIGGSSATLTGQVSNVRTGETAYWFEYGLSTAYGWATPRGQVTVTDTARPQPVSAVAHGLPEAATVHYRVCAVDDEGSGICGADATFVTTSGLDTVTGTGTSVVVPQLGYAVGAHVDARSGPDGEEADGTASTSPGLRHFKVADSGEVTCLRVEGNLAAIGFVAPDWTGTGQPDLPILVRIEDNGPAGDRFATGTLAPPYDTCPTPTALPSTAQTVTAGGWVVHEH